MKLFAKLLKFFKHDTEKLEHLKKDIDIDDHTIPIEELFDRLKTDQDTGLSTEEANERLRMYGPNTLTPPFQTPAWLKFLQNLFDIENKLKYFGDYETMSIMRTRVAVTMK